LYLWKLKMSKRVVLGNLGSSLYGLRVSKSGTDAINTNGSAVDVTNLLFDSVNPIGHLPIYRIYDVTVNAATAVSGSSGKVVTPTNKTVSFGETLTYVPLVEGYEISGTNDYKSVQRIDNSYRSGFNYSRTTVPTDEGFFCTAYDDEIIIANFYQSQKTFRIFLMQPPASAATGASTTVNTVDWSDISVSNTATGIGETNLQTITGINTNVTLRASTGGTTVSKIEAVNNAGTVLATANNASTLDVAVGLNTQVKWRFTNPGVNSSFTATVTNQTDGAAFVDSYGVAITSAPTYSLSGTTTVTEPGNCSYVVSTTSVAAGTAIYWQIVSATTADFSAVSGQTTVQSNGNAPFSFTAKEDNTIEGSQEFTIQIATAAGFGGSVKDSLTLTVSDASPSYSLSGPGTISEGSSGSYTVSTNNVANGVTLYWTINGTTADFNAVQGTTTVNSNSAPITITAKADSTTENTEQYTLSVRTGGYSGTVVASQLFNVSDTSVTPESGSLSPATASFTEGSGTVSFTATISDRQSSTFNWQITRNDGTVGSGEFSTATSGTFTSTSYNISVGITNDSTSEINYQGESFTITLRSGGTIGSGTILDFSTFTLYDDDTVVSATNQTIPNNATIHDVTFTNTMVASANISGRIKNASNTVIKTFNAVNGSNSVTSIADVPSAGSTATYYIELYNGVAWLSGASYTVTRLGTPTYSLNNINSVNEGVTFTYTLTTTNILDGAVFYWRIDGVNQGVTGDFSATQGTTTQVSNNSCSFSITTIADSSTENTETFDAKVFTDSNRTNQVAVDRFEVNDTSTGGGGGGGGECFIAGSQVLMADRTYKPIEEVQVGDKVIGLDETVNEVVDLRIHEETSRILCDLGNQYTFVTDTHPFLDSEGYWTAVNLTVAQEKYPNLQLRELTPGTTLIKYDADLKAYIPYTVSYINQTVHNVRVYNLNVSGEDTPEIPGNDTYIVNGYIVHNK
jgi:hypothetical protein